MKPISVWTALAVAVLLVWSGSVLADQKIKTKSNIKNDRMAASSSGACPDKVNERCADNTCADTATVNTDCKGVNSAPPLAPEKTAIENEAKAEGKISP